MGAKAGGSSLPYPALPPHRRALLFMSFRLMNWKGGAGGDPRGADGDPHGAGGDPHGAGGDPHGVGGDPRSADGYLHREGGHRRDKDHVRQRVCFGVRWPGTALAGGGLALLRDKLIRRNKGQSADGSAHSKF
jgi:hypothetical protein